MSRHGSKVKSMADELLATHDHDAVIQTLVKEYNNVNTVITTLSNIKNQCTRDPRCIDQHKLQAVLGSLSAECKEMVMDKYNQGPREMIDYCRRNDIARPNDLLVPWVSGLRLDREIYESRAKAAEGPRQTRTITIHDLKGLLIWLRTGHTNIYQAILQLAMATGRRTVEILLTGTFTQGVDDNICMFSGQAKGEKEEYMIPLLIPFQRVQDILGYIRNEAGTEHMDNTDENRSRIHQRYASSLRRHLKKEVESFFHGDLHAHDLRAVYAYFTYECMMDGHFTYPAWIQKVLGHASDVVSIHYNRVRMHNPDHIDPGQMLDLPRLTFE